MAQTDYNIHDVTVRDVPTFARGGGVQNVTQVTFYVGPDHGPFQLTYPAGTATGVQIRQDMETKVRELRTISGEV